MNMIQIFSNQLKIKISGYTNINYLIAADFPSSIAYRMTSEVYHIVFSPSKIPFTKPLLQFLIPDFLLAPVSSLSSKCGW